MSTFCTQCGAVLPDAARFCTTCGTAVAHVEAPAPPSAAPATAAPPPAAEPATPGLGRGRKLLAAALALGGVALAALLLLAEPPAPAPPIVATPTAPPPAASPPARTAAPVAPPPATSARITAERWERYTNTRYGVSLEYPADLFTAGSSPPDNAGRSFGAPAAKARFHVYNHANAFGASLDELQAEDVLEIGDDQPQKIVRTDGYAVIGARDGEMIVRRVLLSEGGAFVHRLEIAYPLADAKRFEAIMGRMIGSFTVDPSLPAKAAAAAERAAPAGEPRWQAIDSIGLGLRPRGTRQRAGLSFEIPADWRRVRLPESYLLEYEGFTDKGAKLRLLVEAFASPANVALAREAAAIKSVIRAGVEDYREGNEADLTAALRPARRLTLTFVAMDSPEAQRQEYLLVRAGGTVFKILVDGPAAEGATIRRVLDHVAQTLGVAE